MLCIIISSPSHKSQFVQYVLKYKQHVLKYVCSLNYNSLLLLSKKKKTMYWTTTLIFHWVLEKQNKHIKATKIGNHLKPLETIQNHPQPPKTICNPPETPATTCDHPQPVRIYNFVLHYKFFKNSRKLSPFENTQILSKLL